MMSFLWYLNNYNQRDILNCIAKFEYSPIIKLDVFNLDDNTLIYVNVLYIVINNNQFRIHFTL